MTNPSSKNKTDFPLPLPEFDGRIPPLDIGSYNFAVNQFEKAITLTEQVEALGELEANLDDALDDVQAAIDIAKREIARRAVLAREAAEDPRNAEVRKYKLEALHVLLGGITDDELQAYMEYRNEPETEQHSGK